MNKYYFSWRSFLNFPVVESVHHLTSFTMACELAKKHLCSIANNQFSHVVVWDENREQHEEYALNINRSAVNVFKG